MRHELFLPQLSGRTASYFCRGRQLLEQAGSTLLTAAFSFAPRPTDRRRRHSFILVYGCRQPYETAPPPMRRRADDQLLLHNPQRQRQLLTVSVASLAHYGSRQQFPPLRLTLPPPVLCAPRRCGSPTYMYYTTTPTCLHQNYLLHTQ